MPFADNRCVYIRFQLHVASDVPLIRRRGSIFFPAQLEQINIKETCGGIVEFDPEFHRALFVEIFKRFGRKSRARINIVILSEVDIKFRVCRMRAIHGKRFSLVLRIGRIYVSEIRRGCAPHRIHTGLQAVFIDRHQCLRTLFARRNEFRARQKPRESKTSAERHHKRQNDY